VYLYDKGKLLICFAIYSLVFIYLYICLYFFLLYEVISTTQPINGEGTYNLLPVGGDGKLIENISEEDLIEKYEVAKLQFKAGRDVDELMEKRENFPDLNNFGEDEFKTVLKNCMADGFEFGFTLIKKDFNANNKNRNLIKDKNYFFVIYLPCNNNTIKDNISKIKSKYTTSTQIRLYGKATELLQSFDQIQSKKSYSEDSICNIKPSTNEPENNNINGTKFTARNLTRKSNMIANIIYDRYMLV
jgi:hypothetical protein